MCLAIRWWKTIIRVFFFKQKTAYEIQPLIWRIFHGAVVEIETVNVDGGAHREKTKAAVLRLQPCALPPKGQGGYDLQSILHNCLWCQWPCTVRCHREAPPSVFRRMCSWAGTARQDHR